MVKRISLILLFVSLLAAPVYGHLAGAFADFLAIVHDESTIDQLKDEMAETKRQIEQLQPEVEAYEAHFVEDRDVAAEQLRVYADTGLDVWLAMMKSGSDPADLLGAQKMMERGIASYLDELNGLYLDYQQLKAAQDSLKGHEKLLAVIGKNLEARKTYLAENEGLPLEQIANYLDIDWMSEVEYELIDELAADAALIKEELGSWVSASKTGTLTQDWLSERSALHYFFRDDHLYIEYELEFAHVILLGQVLQDSAGEGADLVFEAGFYNGFYLPEELLEELHGFHLDYAALQQATGLVDPYLIQLDGALGIQGKQE